jgi:basic membrane protein A and related proteins
MKSLRGFAIGLVSLTLLVACGGGGQGQQGPSNGGGKPKVAFIWVDPVNGSGWTLEWDRARKSLESSLGVQTTAVGPIAESADVVPVYEDLIRKGYGIIFATAFGYQPFTTEVAKKHPDIKFIGIGPNTQAHLDNVATVYGNLWEARYVTGVAAGLVTKANKIGFVAAHTIPSVVAGINGFALGVQSVNPQAVVKVSVTNTWYDPPTETQASNALIQGGADVLAQHEDSTASLLAADKSKIWAVGSEADTHDVAPGAYLTGTYYNWTKYAKDQVKAVMDKTWKADDYSGDLESGLIAIGPVNAKASADVKAKVDQAIADLKSGKVKVFTGPITSNTGQVMIPSSTTWSVQDIYTKSTFFVKGVDGKVAS